MTPLQNAGANRNVCHQIPVKCDGDENVSINVENEDTFSPLLTSMRTLHSWESVAGDFAKKETVSTILEQLHSKDKRLNEVEIRTVIKSVEKFSGLEHSVEADDPFTGEVRVHKVTVDVTSQQYRISVVIFTVEQAESQPTGCRGHRPQPRPRTP